MCINYYFCAHYFQTMQTAQDSEHPNLNQQETTKEFEKKRFLHSIIKSVILVSILWFFFLINDIFGLHWNDYGILPRDIKGLLGIFTLPFLHGDLSHLFSNSVPLLVLFFSIFYFFDNKAVLILMMTWFMSGMLTWVTGTDGVHIGASGIVYALAFFLITISILKQEPKLMAYSLIIIFLYGSIVWGFFPQLFPDKHISWEGHLAGAITGITLAFFYRNEGPVKRLYFIEEEELVSECTDDEVNKEKRDDELKDIGS